VPTQEREAAFAARRRAYDDEVARARATVPALARSLGPALHVARASGLTTVYDQQWRRLRKRFRYVPAGSGWLVGNVWWHEPSDHPKDEGIPSKCDASVVLSPDGGLRAARRDRYSKRLLALSSDALGKAAAEGEGQYWVTVLAGLTCLAAENGIVAP
jgi:hypothetical protein